MKQYSLKKGLGKGVVSALTVAASLVAFAGLSDVSLWDLATQYIKPVLGTLTVGGVVTVLINYVKIKTAE